MKMKRLAGPRSWHRTGVHRECSDADIKKAYRRESLKHHPDKVRPTDCNAPGLQAKTTRALGWRRGEVQACRRGALDLVRSHEATPIRPRRGRRGHGRHGRHGHPRPFRAVQPGRWVRNLRRWRVRRGRWVRRRKLRRCGFPGRWLPLRTWRARLRRFLTCCCVELFRHRCIIIHRMSAVLTVRRISHSFHLLAIY